MKALPVLRPGALPEVAPPAADGKTDCLVVGFAEEDFASYVRSVRSMGERTGAFRDLNLAFIEYEGRPYRALDIINRLNPEHGGRLHNGDFLWPVVAYLCTYLWRRGFSYDYINVFQQERDAFREKLLAGNIRAIAVTTTLYVSPQPILEVIEFIRAHDPDVTIVVGGPYISNLPRMADEGGLEDLLSYLGADVYVISQEGETELVQVLTALRAGASLAGVPNIAYREGDDFVVTKGVVPGNDLEDNMVNYRLFAERHAGELLLLRTAKSCPFTCAFCGFPERAGEYRYLDVAHVEAELDAVRELGGITTLTFIDDTFNVPKGRFKDLMRMMIRNRYGFRWNCFYRSDNGDDETIALMAEAGCEGVFLGVESGSDSMLERMDKTSRQRHYMKAIPAFRRAGIATYTSLIIGFPGETDRTVRETIDFVEEARPDYWRAQLWYADPVTPVWKQREAYRIKGSGFEWSHATMDSQTACDIIDDMFLNVRGSTWLPQWGFELWSTFYLQRKGMSRGRLLEFMGAFNAAVKHKLRTGQRELTDPALIAELSRACHFDR
ncbi:MAG: PhpK family radical SAM P-methyltransferase [Polyangiaceae bacterium]|nr:PhpK family radical SAM P-methyltransferase [Polyangiaceae bacterium]